MAELRVTSRLAIDEDSLEERFILSSGAGGQNVNKVASAVQLRFDLGRDTRLPERVRERLRALAGRRLTQDDVIIIEARRQRTQEGNRRDARERLVAMIREAAQPVRPRRPTRPTVASRRRRIESKKARSATKQARGKPSLD